MTDQDPVVMVSVGGDIRRTEATAPCGCMAIGVLGRCALAVPCDAHAGQMVFVSCPAAMWQAVTDRPALAEVVAMLRRAMDAEDPDEWIADAIALMARLDPAPAS